MTLEGVNSVNNRGLPLPPPPFPAHSGSCLRLKGASRWEACARSTRQNIRVESPAPTSIPLIQRQTSHFQLTRIRLVAVRLVTFAYCLTDFSLEQNTVFASRAGFPPHSLSARPVPACRSEDLELEKFTMLHSISYSSTPYAHSS